MKFVVIVAIMFAMLMGAVFMNEKIRGKPIISTELPGVQVPDAFKRTVDKPKPPADSSAGMQGVTVPDAFKRTTDVQPQGTTAATSGAIAASAAAASATPPASAASR
jgi:hypothetical protein